MVKNFRRLKELLMLSSSKRVDLSEEYPTKYNATFRIKEDPCYYFTSVLFIISSTTILFLP